MFSNELVVEILNYLDSNLYTKISILELSKHFNYNKDYIMRLFKRELNITIFDYLNQRRILNSLQDYKYNYSSILNIALNYGFYSQEYYSEMFHKTIGVAPRTYLKFINHNININNDEINTIINRIASLEYKFRTIDNYKLNTIPSRQVKILSIFK